MLLFVFLIKLFYLKLIVEGSFIVTDLSKLNESNALKGIDMRLIRASPCIDPNYIQLREKFINYKRNILKFDQLMLKSGFAPEYDMISDIIKRNKHKISESNDSFCKQSLFFRN